jgi:kumamolisin
MSEPAPSSFAPIALPGSERPPPEGKRMRRVPRSLRIELSVYLRPREGARGVDETLIGQAGYRHLDADELASERAALHQADFELIEQWASAAGLAVTRRDPARRLIKVVGSVERIENALGTRLYSYRDGETRFRGREGPLHLPASVAEIVEGVFGLDTRPVAEMQLGAFNPALAGGHLPAEFAGLYNFPVTPGLGKGQTIALIMFAGGYADSDIDLAFAAMGHAKPLVVSEAVAGGLPDYGANARADKEVALDIQIAGGLAPGAKIVVYFAPNTAQGWVDAVSRAVHDTRHNPSIISISWATSELTWKTTFPALMSQLSQNFQDAARLGITVLAASGDTGAILRTPGRAAVTYPASDPFVCGCGGTSLVNGAGGKLTETVWNRPAAMAGGPARISGGGVSEVFRPPPAFQAGAAVPGHANGGPPGRGVPDVAAIADDRIGYRIFLYGTAVVGEGTSAAAPLWAGLIARINEAKGRRSGYLLPRLYAAAAGTLNDVVTGDNKVGGVGYSASAGWDPCTGLGSPNGVKLLAIL